MSWNWIIFILASLGLIGVGFLTGRKIQTAESEGEGFLLGGKQIGAFVGAGTLIATGYSGWGFIGASGTAYAYGPIELLANFMYAPAIAFGTLWFASYMRKNADAMGGLTVPDYLARIHKGPEKQKRIVHFIAGLATLVFLTVYMIGQIRATGLVAAKWLGTSETIASFLLLTVIVIFTVQGGLLGVAVTDTIMCMGMIVGTIIIMARIRMDIPITQLFSEIGKSFPEMMNPLTSTPYGTRKYSVFLVFIYALLFTTCLPYMSVRFLSLSEDIKIHKLSLFAAIFGLILSFIPFAGLYVLYKNPNLEVADAAMPYFLNNFLNPVVGGIITLFILFAMLSTISSVLQTQAAALSHDIMLSTGLGKGKSEHTINMINRLAVVAIAVVSLLLTYVAPQGMLNQISYIGTGGLISMLVGPTICQIVVKGDTKACIVSMIVGLILNIYLVYDSSFGWVEAPVVAGLIAGIIYMVMGYIANGMSRFPKEN